MSTASQPFRFWPESPAARLQLGLLTGSEVIVAAAIDRLSFPGASWTSADVRHFLRGPFSCGHVVRLHGRAVGYVLTEFRATAEIHRVAVHPDFRRKGIGRMLVERITNGPGPDGEGRTVELVVPESNIDACLFFKAMSFRSTLCHGEYGQEDGIEFVRRKPKCVGK